MFRDCRRARPDLSSHWCMLENSEVRMRGRASGDRVIVDAAGTRVRPRQSCWACPLGSSDIHAAARARPRSRIDACRWSRARCRTAPSFAHFVARSAASFFSFSPPRPLLASLSKSLASEDGVVAGNGTKFLVAAPQKLSADTQRCER